MKLGRTICSLLLLVFAGKAIGAPVPVENDAEALTKRTGLTASDKTILNELAKEAQEKHAQGVHSNRLVTAAGRTKSGKTVFGSSQGDSVKDNDGHAEDDLLKNHDNEKDPITHVVSFGNSKKTPGALKVIPACGEGSSKAQSCSDLLTKNNIKFHDKEDAEEASKELQLPTNHDPSKKGSLVDDAGNKVGPAIQKDPETGKAIFKASPGHRTDKENMGFTQEKLEDHLAQQGDKKKAKAAQQTGGKRPLLSESDSSDSDSAKEDKPGLTSPIKAVKEQHKVGVRANVVFV